eukprot:g11164.t1
MSMSMSNTESGSRLTNDTHQEEGSVKLGFNRFRKQQQHEQQQQQSPQHPKPQQRPVGSPPPEPSPTAPSPATGWGGRGSNPITPHPSPPPLPSGTSSTVARPMRPSHDGRLSDPHREEEEEGGGTPEEETRGGGSGSDWGDAAVDEEEEEGLSEGADKAEAARRTEVAAEQAYGGDDNPAAADGSDGEAAGGREENHQLHVGDESVDEESGGKAGWNQHQRKPAGVVCGRYGVSSRDREEEEEEEEEEGGEKENHGQQAKRHGSPAEEGGATVDDREEPALGGSSSAGGEEAAQHHPPSGGEYDDHDDTQQQQQRQSPMMRSRGDQGFGQGAHRQLLPLPRPQRPGHGQGSLPAGEQEEEQKQEEGEAEAEGEGEEEEEVRSPQTRDSDDFQTHAVPQHQDRGSEEDRYNDDDDDDDYDDGDLGAHSEDDLSRRNVDGVGEVGASGTEVGQREGLQQHLQGPSYHPSDRFRFPGSHRTNRREGLGEQEEDENEEEVMVSDEEARESRRGLQQHQRRHDELQQQQQQQQQQRGEPPVGADKDNRQGEETAGLDPAPSPFPPPSPLAGFNLREIDPERDNEAAQKWPRQGRPHRQQQHGGSAPQSQASELGAFAVEDDEERLGAAKTRGHEAGADGGSDHSDRAGQGIADAIVGAAAATQSRIEAVNPSRPLKMHRSQGGPVAATKTASNSGTLVGARVSDAEQEGGPTNGDMVIVEDSDRTGQEYAGEDEGMRVKRKREESRAILSRKVTESFEKITNSFLMASSTIRDVEAEQNKMIRHEESIKKRLLKSGESVREATRAMQLQLLAAFTGDGSDEGNPADEPRGSKGGAPRDQLGGPPGNDGAPRRPMALNIARTAASRPDAASAAAVTSQQPHGVGGGISGSHGSHQSRHPKHLDAMPEGVAGALRGASDVSSNNLDGGRSSSSRPAFKPTTTGGDTGAHRGGGYEKWTPGYGGVNRSNAEGGSAFSRARHAHGAAAQAMGGGVLGARGGGGGATGFAGVAGGRAGGLSSSSGAKRPCRADFARGRRTVVAGDTASPRSDGRKNGCLEIPGSRCQATATGISLVGCNLSNDDLSDIAACFDSVGRGKITDLRLDHNALTAVEPGVFDDLDDLEILTLDNNNIASIPSGLFDGRDKLEQLDLSSNQLTSLPPSLFGTQSGLDSLKSLFLNDNKIVLPPREIFRGLKAVSTLGLSFNEISTLPLGVFDGLDELQILTLDRNSISILPKGIFDGLRKLEILYVNDNELQTFEGTILQDLGKLTSLDIKGNSGLQCLPVMTG